MCEITEIWDSERLAQEFSAYKREYQDAWVNTNSAYTDAGYELQRITQRIGGVPAVIDPLNFLHTRWKRIELIHKQAFLMKETPLRGEVDPNALLGVENKYRSDKWFGFDALTKVA